MASSMLTAELSATASADSDVDKALKAASHSCANDPDFAIICHFLQKFSKDLGLDLPNFKLLLQWLTKTDEVSPQLKDMQIKLLRKTRKTVHEKSWESALSKFCFTYSAQDGWEIERFGYKNSNVKVKLRILRELLECQFERNSKFRAKILTFSADSLRSKPIGRDRQGHAYWVTQDNDCNIRIYQEHLDEEIWQVVATNRVEFVHLINRLRGSEVVQPCRDIGIVDEDTSSSSHVDSNSVQKAFPPEEKYDSQEDEQKVPKLSIKLVHRKSSKEMNSIKRHGKGEEDIAAEEDAKLLKKLKSSETIESGEEEFEEIEEEYEDESGSDHDDESGKESEDENNDEISQLKKTETEHKIQKDFKSKDDNKKVKPLLISQNKVLNNENCSTSSSTVKKRTMDQLDYNLPSRNENQVATLKKLRPSLLDSKRPKTGKNKEQYKSMDEENYDESAEESIEIEEEIEEEDIDSVAAEEDENEEKQFEDYEDDNEEDIGEEICDPIVHITGEGSGKDCDIENYLYLLDYDFEIDSLSAPSNVIVEDICYVRGEGNGKESLVGNRNDDNEINTLEKAKDEHQPVSSATQTKQDTECPKICNNSNDSLNDTKEIDKVLSVKNEKCNDNKIKIQESLKDDPGHINGEKQTKDDSKNEAVDEKKVETNKEGGDSPILRSENSSEDIYKAGNKKLGGNVQISSSDSAAINVLTPLTHASKMSALESLKKELRESKQKLLVKKLPQTSESGNIKLSCASNSNRKRRLTDQLQTTTARPSNSESEIDLNFENNEDLANDKELEINKSEENVGGKRLKMRPKHANTEQRKKIEAKKVAATEENTSSSGGEEELRKRTKAILSKHPSNESHLKSEKKVQSLQSKNHSLAKNDENLTKVDEKSKSASLSEDSPPLKRNQQIICTKIKPTLAEIIEKKYKKSSEKNCTEPTAAAERNTVETITKKQLVATGNKSPVAKPLKKNLLIQIKQEEDVVPRKHTNSQDLNLSEIKSFEKTTTPERQRKRRSSEEAVQTENPEEPEPKKEVSVIEKNATLKCDNANESIKKEGIKTKLKDIKIQKESMPISRRSGRLGKVVPDYADNLQPKRNSSSTKTSTRKDVVVSAKINANNQQSRCEKEQAFSVCEKVDIDVDVKIKEGKSTTNKASLHKEYYGKEDNTRKKDTSTKVEDSPPKPILAIKTPVKGVRTQHEVDATNIIDIDSETPVRQSRRIAQQKIREEAERRKLEEIALRTMKQELKKKKKAEQQFDPTVVPPTEPSSESEESDVEIKRKVQKKKCPGKNGNWSSGSEEQEEPEEEDEEPPHYESDPGSPLFKSDHEFSPESDIEDESQVVPMKRARTVRKEDADGDVTNQNEQEEEACQKCNKSDHPEWILLCDKCDKGYHCSCLSPVLFYIPEGDWYCPPCQQEQLIKALENQLKEFDDLVENKKKIEELEKRMAEEEKERKDREEEINKSKTKKDKRIDAKRNNDNSSADDHSHVEDDGDEGITNSDDSKDSDLKNQSGRNSNRNRSRNSKNSDKRSNRDRRHNITRSRRSKLIKQETDYDSDCRRSAKSDSESKSSSSSSSTYSESDNEPIYKLRKRRQINVSYRLNEYDDLINSALKKEMDEAAGAGNLGRGKDISTIIEADKEEKARQKQKQDSEDVVSSKEGEKDETVKKINSDSPSIEPNETKKGGQTKETQEEENDSDAEPIMHKFDIKSSQKKKSRKLTTLDISSEDDGSDEDFKGSSFDDEEEEDTSISASNSDSSLEIYRRHGKSKKKRRKAARRAFRERRRDRRFLVDDSDDEEVQRPKSKKKRKDDSEYTESEVDDDNSELSENIDSADLCDDTTTEESDGAWKPNKRKKAKKANTLFEKISPKIKSVPTKKPKKVEYSDDDVSESEDEDDDENEEIGSGKGMGKQPRSQPVKTSNNSTKTKGKGKEKPPAKTKKKKSSENETSQSDSEDSTRRTRGRRYAYIEDFDDDSSDGGIKPGVQRPDTPPEEREKFIKRQEEIKRMLAEKNAEGAKLVATPRLTPIKTDGEKDKRSPAKAGGDSLSTVPLSVIRQAKVLDIDYLQRRGENLDDLNSEVGEVDDDFDDADLPDDLPEDMDEDAIARMVEEEEEFGVATGRDLPAPDEILRTTNTVKPPKAKEVEKNVSQSSMSSSLPTSNSQVNPVNLPTTTSGLQEPVRKRLPMPTIHPPLLRHQFLMHDSMSSTQHLMHRQGGIHTSHLLQNALSAPLSQPLERNYPSTPSAQHPSIMNRMSHSIPLQPTVSHVLSTARPSQPTLPSIATKPSALHDQPALEKSANAITVIENKPRGRRKKITPLRDTLQKQQIAAAVTAATATSSALASALVKCNEPIGTSLMSSVIKSGSAPKLPMQASVITNMSPTSLSAPNRQAVVMPPISGAYVRNDGPRFYDALGSRISQTGMQRHRGPPQMPSSMLPPHPANRSSYGLPPPLKGPNTGPSVSSSNTSVSLRNPMRHVSPPYLGIPPNARHASHLNMYRPPMFGNPNFGPRVNLRPPNIHSPDYSPGSRAYTPYGFYPPPPPLTAPGQRSGTSSVPQSSTQMPPVQSTLTHPPASVIVSAACSKSSNSTITQQTPPPTAEVNDSSSNSKSVTVTHESPIKIAPPKPSSPTTVIAQTEKVITAALTVAEPRKKLTTLQAFVASSAKKSPVLPSSDSPISHSSPNPPTDVNDDSSAPEASENMPTVDEPTRQEGQASEFSGLVSYFSSQHDDYNT